MVWISTATATVMNARAMVKVMVMALSLKTTATMLVRVKVTATVTGPRMTVTVSDILDGVMVTVTNLNISAPVSLAGKVPTVILVCTEIFLLRLDTHEITINVSASANNEHIHDLMTMWIVQKLMSVSQTHVRMVARVAMTSMDTCATVRLGGQVSLVASVRHCQKVIRFCSVCTNGIIILSKMV